MAIVIEKGVPVPIGVRPGGLTAAARKMEVGDSILVDDTGYALKSTSHFNRVLHPNRFVARKVEGGKRRIWRVA